MFSNLKDKAKAKYDDLKNKDKNKKQEGHEEGKYDEMHDEEHKEEHQEEPHNDKSSNVNKDKDIQLKEKRPSRMEQMKLKLDKAGQFLNEKSDNLKKGAKVLLISRLFTKGLFSFSGQVHQRRYYKTKKRNELMDCCNFIFFYQFESKADEKVVNVMVKMEPKLIASFEDSSMPGCVRRFVEEMVINLWRDVTDIMRFEMRIAIQKPEMQLSKRPDKYCCLKPWYIFRNWYLYATIPFNKDFWTKAKTKSFIFFKLLQSISIYGVQTAMFFLLFLAIDKSEEFQLVNFILGYKNIQFLTAGCLNAIVGYFLYFHCATIEPSESVKELFMDKEAQKQAAQAQSRFLQQTNSTNSTNSTYVNPYQVLDYEYCFLQGPDVSTFFFQIILIWIAYFALYCSKSKTDFIEEKMRIKKELRGGRLTYFMIYDLFAFAGTLLFGILTYFSVYYIPGQPAKLYQETAGLIYFCKMLYGLLSFPFLIFSVGFFVKLFTSAKPTGYDKFGNAVPVLDKIKLVYEELPPGEEEEIDIGELLG